MALPFEDNTFDHVYVIEATCHAPDKVKRPYSTSRFSSMNSSFESAFILLFYSRQNALLKYFVFSNRVVLSPVTIGV